MGDLNITHTVRVAELENDRDAWRSVAEGHDRELAHLREQLAEVQRSESEWANIASERATEITTLLHDFDETTAKGLRLIRENEHLRTALEDIAETGSLGDGLKAHRALQGFR